MAVSVSDIKNLQSDADAKASGAAAFMDELEGIVVSLDELQNTLNRFVFFDYETSVKDITSYLDDLVSMKDQSPDEPDGFGSFTIESAPTYTPSDLTTLRTALAQLLTTVETLPSKVTEAVNIADALYNLLYIDLTVGGYGIETGDEEALVNRIKDRELLGANSAIADTSSKFAALGYRLPPGALTATLSEIIQKARTGLSEGNREIYIKRAELFRDNRRYTIEQARAIADFYIGFTSKKAEMLNTVTVAKLNEARLTVDSFLGELKAWETKVNKVVKEQGLIADVYKIKSDIWRTKIDATSTGVTAISEANKIQALTEQAKADGKLKELALAVDIKKEDFLVNMTKVTGQAEAYSRIASAMLGSISGIVGLIHETIED